MAFDNWLPIEKADILLQQGALLIDVRTPEEFATGHAKDAVNIPIETLNRNPNLIPSGNLIFYCRSGHRSGLAQKLMHDLGITTAHNLGGLTEAKSLYSNQTNGSEWSS